MIILAAALLIGVAVWLTRGRRRRPPADDPPPRYPPRPLAGPPVPAGQLARGRIVVSGLTKEYRGRRVVDGLSFVAEPGRVTGFLGPNGAGKTTTLRMLLGLAEPAAGQATIGGCRYAALAQPARQVGAVLEASSAHQDRTGRDHLRILCVTAGLPLARADEVLELTGLGAAGRRPAGGYSLGMRQRLGVAAAQPAIRANAPAASSQ